VTAQTTAPAAKPDAAPPGELPTVWQAFAAAKAEMSPVGKDSVNDQQHFRFRGVDAVVNAAAQALNRHGVILVPVLLKAKYGTVEVGQKRTLMANVRVRVRYEVTGPRGDHFDVVVPGEAMDSGDKGVAKAMSVAYRIALIQSLNLPTGDPEVDATSYERSPRQAYSAADAFDSATPAPRRQAAQVQVPPLADDDPWKAKIDDIADKDEATAVYAEVAEMRKAGTIDDARAARLGSLITARVANLGLAAQNAPAAGTAGPAQAQPPARIRQEDQGAPAPAVPPAADDAAGDSAEAAFVVGFYGRLAALTDLRQVLPMQREVGAAIRDRKLTDVQLIRDVQEAASKRGRELELAAKGAAA
jgi:ERF superfamily